MKQNSILSQMTFNTYILPGPYRQEMFYANHSHFQCHSHTSSCTETDINIKDQKFSMKKLATGQLADN